MALALLLAACGPEAVSDAGVETDAGADAGADASTPDAGPETDAGGSSDAGHTIDAGETTSAGVGIFTISNTVSIHVVTGYFSRVLSLDAVLQGSLAPVCTETAVDGSCRSVVCPADTPAFVEAGVVTAAVNGTPLDALTRADGNIYQGSGSGRIFEGGDTVSFAGTGGEAPAFTGSVTAPDRPILTLPDTIDRTSPLTVSWTIASAPDLAQLTLIAGEQVIVCSVDGAAGSVVVPTSLLSALSTSDSAILSVGLSNVSRSRAEGWDIAIIASEGQAAVSVTIE